MWAALLPKVRQRLRRLMTTMAMGIQTQTDESHEHAPVKQNNKLHP
jgi:hypothetical protein